MGNNMKLVWDPGPCWLLSNLTFQPINMFCKSHKYIVIGTIKEVMRIKGDKTIWLCFMARMKTIYFQVRSSLQNQICDTTSGIESSLLQGHLREASHIHTKHRLLYSEGQVLLAIHFQKWPAIKPTPNPALMNILYNPTPDTRPCDSRSQKEMTLILLQGIPLLSMPHSLSNVCFPTWLSNKS